MNDTTTRDESEKDLERDESESSDEDAMSENENRHIAEEDEESDLSDAQSVATDDAFRQEAVVPVATSAPQPVLTAEQAARISARPRITLKFRVGAAGSSRPPLPLPQTLAAPQQPPPPPPSNNPDESSQSNEPESTAEPPKDKGKGKEVLFAVEAHKRPLTAEEQKGLNALTFNQQCHLKEKFRAEITQEARPGHRAEFSAKMEATLAAETANWEAEKKRWWKEKLRTEAQYAKASKGAEKLIDKLNEKTVFLDQQVLDEFAKGVEHGEKSAVAYHEKKWATKKNELHLQAQQLKIEKQQLEGLASAEIAAKSQTIAQQEQQIQQMGQERQDRNSRVDDLTMQLSAKGDEIKRTRDVAESSVASLQWQLAADTAHLQSQLAAELQSHSQALQAIALERTAHEQGLAEKHSESIRQVVRLSYSRSQGNQEDFSGLTDILSTLRLPSDDREPEPATSASTMLHEMLAEQKAANKQLSQELARKQAEINDLRLSLAKSEASKQNQPPPAEESSARLQEARHEAELPRESADNAARIQVLESAVRREKRLRTEEKRLSEAVVARTKKTASEEKETASEEKEAAIAAVTKKADEKIEAANAEARSLRAAYRALLTENEDLEEKSSSTLAELNSANSELDTCRVQAKHLAKELGEVGDLLAVREGFIKREAEEIAELDQMVDGRLRVWTNWEERIREAASAPESATEKEPEVETGEKEMDALLGIPERANQGPLRSLFPSWNQFLVLLLMGLFVVGSVYAFSAVSAANGERLRWLEANRRIENLRRFGISPESSWRDSVLLDLSAGMYGV